MNNYRPVFSSSVSFHTAVIMPLTCVLFFMTIPILSPVLKYGSWWLLMYKEINSSYNYVHSPGILPVTKATQSLQSDKIWISLCSAERKGRSNRPLLQNITHLLGGGEVLRCLLSSQLISITHHTSSCFSCVYLYAASMECNTIHFCKGAITII